MNPHRSSSQKSPAGFSLFEVLVMVALLGIMTAIVVPALTSSSRYEAARNQRNAQEMTAICSAAQAAGLNLVVPGDLAATVRNILNGGSPLSGPFKDKHFGASGLTEPDALKAITYLKLQDTALLYQAEAL